MMNDNEAVGWVVIGVILGVLLCLSFIFIDGLVDDYIETHKELEKLRLQLERETEVSTLEDEE